MLNINIQTIPHKEQRYDTCGDYYENNGVTEIKVSQLDNQDYEFLIAVHEMIEHYLTKRVGITEAEITAFDEAFEKLRADNQGVIGNQEPGNMASAPYHKEHVFATDIENMIAAHMNIYWQAYEDKVNSL